MLAPSMPRSAAPWGSSMVGLPHGARVFSHIASITHPIPGLPRPNPCAGMYVACDGVQGRQGGRSDAATWLRRRLLLKVWTPASPSGTSGAGVSAAVVDASGSAMTRVMDERRAEAPMAGERAATTTWQEDRHIGLCACVRACLRAARNGRSACHPWSAYLGQGAGRAGGDARGHGWATASGERRLHPGHTAGRRRGGPEVLAAASDLLLLQGADGAPAAAVQLCGRRSVRLSNNGARA
jgi:hypothetical protein